MKKGLRERILEAKSVKEVDDLLHEGSTYTNASENTRGAWKRTANIRKASLTKTEPVVEPAEEITPKETPKRKPRVKKVTEQ
jgi:hypothetical protein